MELPHQLHVGLRLGERRHDVPVSLHSLFPRIVGRQREFDVIGEQRQQVTR